MIMIIIIIIIIINIVISIIIIIIIIITIIIYCYDCLYSISTKQSCYFSWFWLRLIHSLISALQIYFFYLTPLKACCLDIPLPKPNDARCHSECIHTEMHALLQSQ